MTPWTRWWGGKLVGLLAMLATLTGAAAAQERPASDAELDALAAEAIAACGAPDATPPTGHALISHAEWLAGLTVRYRMVCSRHPALALRIARRMSATPSAWTVPALILLARLYEQGIGVRADSVQALVYRRRAWLLHDPRSYPPNPFSGLAEQEAFLVRPETIAFLRRFDSPDLPWARLSLARALLARNHAGDRAAAARIAEQPSFNDSADGRFLRARIRLEGAQNAAARSAAIADLRSLVVSVPDARALLAESARRQLAAPASDEDRWEAIRSLAVIAYLLEPDAVAELMRAVESANGGRPADTLTGPDRDALNDRLRAPISDDDYPASALRNEEEEIIVLRGLFDPRGRLIFTEPVTPALSPALLNAVRRIYIRRLPPVELGAARTTPYLWVELPAVVFRLASE